MRDPATTRRLRAAVILAALALLSLQWSIRDDPCARSPTLSLSVVNEMETDADVLLTIFNESGAAVFDASYHLRPGEAVSTGHIRVAPGTYGATARVEGDGWGSAILEAGHCSASAEVQVSVDRVTIVRSQQP